MAHGPSSIEEGSGAPQQLWGPTGNSRTLPYCDLIISASLPTIYSTGSAA